MNEIPKIKEFSGSRRSSLHLNALFSNMKEDTESDETWTNPCIEQLTSRQNQSIPISNLISSMNSQTAGFMSRRCLQEPTISVENELKHLVRNRCNRVVNAALPNGPESLGEEMNASNRENELSPVQSAGAQDGRDVGDVLRSLRSILEHYQTEDDLDSFIGEWQQLARQVDRVLFWLYVFLTAFFTLVLLVFAPLLKSRFERK